MDITRMYYSIPELAVHWDMSPEDVVHLGVTGQIVFKAEATIYYKSSGLYQVNHTLVSPHHILSIYRSKVPFRLPEAEFAGHFKGMCLGKIGEKAEISYQPGIDTFIVDVSEADRYEKLSKFNETTVESKSLDSRAETTYLNIIAALLEYIEGETPGIKKHHASPIQRWCWCWCWCEGLSVS